MNNKYKRIEQYRIILDETWEVFGGRFEQETGISWKTLHKIVNGKSTPNARTEYKIDIWYNNHLEEMFTAISNNIHSRSLKHD